MCLRTPRLLLEILAAVCALSCTSCEEAQGFSTLVPLIVPSQSAVDFGEVFVDGESGRSLQLHSVGTAALAISAVRVEGLGDFLLHEELRGHRLEPKENHTLELRFAPRRAGTHQGWLLVSSDAGNEPELRIALAGVGLAPPGCPPDTECTMHGFDPATGECLVYYLDGPCDDRDACTEETRCVDGECLGVGATCAPDDACSRALCDSETGCVSIFDPAICDDDDLCTADACDPASGCAWAPEPDGTPCGPVEGCAALHLCVQGRCSELPVPDGTPCSDGDHCTTSDTCAGGRCVGERETHAPERVSALGTFGYWFESRAAIFPGGRILFAGWQDNILARDPGAQLTLVETSAGRLEVVARQLLPGVPIGSGAEVVAYGDAWAVVITAASELLSVELSAATGLVAHGPFALPHPVECRAVVAMAPYLFCAGDGVLHVIELSGVSDTPRVVASLASPAVVGLLELVLDAPRARLLGAVDDGVWVADVGDPTAPVDLGLRVPGKRVRRLAVDGQTLVLYRVASGSFSDDPELGLFDADSFESISSIYPLTVDPPPSIAAVGFGAAGLVVLAYDPAALELWDLAVPVAPTLVASEALASWNLELGGHAIAHDLAVIGTWGETLVRGVSPERGISHLTGPLHGSNQRVVEHAGSLVALGEASARVVELQRSGQVRALRGAQFRDHPGGFASLGAGGAVPTYPLWEIRPISFFEQTTGGVIINGDSGQSVGAWHLLSTPWDEVQIGNVRFPVVGFSYRRLATDGFLLSSLQRIDNVPDHGYRLDVVDLREAGVSYTSPLEIAGTVPVPAGVHFELDANVVQLIACDSERPRVAVLVSNSVGGELTLFDLSDPEDPIVVARGSDIDRRALALGLADDRAVAITEPGAGGGPVQVHTYQIVGDAISERGAGPLDLERGGRYQVLAFDGHTALVGERFNVVFVDTDSDPPREIGRVDTAGYPRHALITDDKLLVTSATAIEVIAPPCPPIID